MAPSVDSVDSNRITKGNMVVTEIKISEVKCDYPTLKRSVDTGDVVLFTTLDTGMKLKSKHETNSYVFGYFDEERFKPLPQGSNVTITQN